MVAGGSLWGPARRLGQDGWIPGLVVCVGPTGNLVQSLQDHHGADSHFLDADPVSVIAVCSLDRWPLDGWFPIQLAVDGVWMCGSDVVVHPACPQVGASDSVVDHLLGLRVPDALGPDEENCALVEQCLVLLDPVQEQTDLCPSPLCKAMGQVPLHPPDPGEVVVHPGAAELLEEIHHHLPLPQAPYHHGEVPDVGAICSQPHQVGCDPLQFDCDQSDVLGPLWDLDLEEVLYCVDV